MRLCRLARPPCGCASGINGFGVALLYGCSIAQGFKAALTGTSHVAASISLLLDECFPETFSDCGFSSGLPWARAQNCFKLWPEISIFIKDFPLLESIALATAIGLRVLKPIAMATAIDLPWPRQSISAPLDRLPWLRQSIPTKKNRFSVSYNRLL